MRTILNRLSAVAGIGVLGLAVLAGCGGDDDAAAGDGGGDSDSDRPQIVVTTNILGDVVRNVVGDTADVEVIMPLGADPHEFNASARQAETMSEADLLVTNGAHFEEGLDDAIELAEDSGVEIFAFTDHVELEPFVEMPGDEHAEEGEEGAEGEEEDEHAEEGEGEEEHAEDPHFWTDPTQVAAGVEALGAALADVEGIDAAAIDTQVDSYVTELEALDQEVESTLAVVPAERRVLVTNHEVFGYFAHRYGFEVVGVVIPGGTTLAEPSSAELEDLRETIQEHQLPAIFAETSDSTRLADALASDAGGVEVVELYTESLGEEGSGAETYVDMMRTDAQLIADALG